MIFQCSNDISFPRWLGLNAFSYRDPSQDYNSYPLMASLGLPIPVTKMGSIPQLMRTILAVDYAAHGPVIWHHGIT
jgi:hypothetical protein